MFWGCGLTALTALGQFGISLFITHAAGSMLVTDRRNDELEDEGWAMTTTRPAIKLTDEGARLLLDAAIEHADKMGVPQCIAIVDEGCNLVAFFRMAGSRVLSIQSAQRKAMTAASTGKPTGSLDPAIDLKLAIATDGDMVNIKGGMPIMTEGQVIGGIGVGSGTGDQDLEVANAALSRFGGATPS